MTKFQNRLDTVGKFLNTVGKSVRMKRVVGRVIKYLYRFSQAAIVTDLLEQSLS